MISPGPGGSYFVKAQIKTPPTGSGEKDKNWVHGDRPATGRSFPSYSIAGAVPLDRGVLGKDVKGADV